MRYFQNRQINLPLLSAKAKSAISRLLLDDLQSYDSMKLYVLNEFRETVMNLQQNVACCKANRNSIYKDI
jgi:hypothetical protein